MNVQTLLFATHNIYKLSELKKITPSYIQIKSLDDVGIDDTIPEDYDTLKENAIQKCKWIYNKTNYNTISDDTGLEVEALNGNPGVFSARYAGVNASDKDNMKKLLDEMNSITNRKACFKTIIALMLNDKLYTFEGKCNGYIDNKMNGNLGFGYDPVFIPENYDKTFAELGSKIKNQISHRKKAFEKLSIFLNPITP